MKDVKQRALLRAYLTPYGLETTNQDSRWLLRAKRRTRLLEHKRREDCFALAPR